MFQLANARAERLRLSISIPYYYYYGPPEYSGELTFSEAGASGAVLVASFELQMLHQLERVVVATATRTSRTMCRRIIASMTAGTDDALDAQRPRIDELATAMVKLAARLCMRLDSPVSHLRRIRASRMHAQE